MSAIGEQAASGFTLIEALVVVAMTALLAGLMFPQLQGAISGQEFRTARSQMILGVRSARAGAIRQGAAVRFDIEQGGAGFRVEGRAASPLPASVRLSREGGGAGRGGDRLAFYPDGTSNGGKLVLAGRDRRESFIIFPTTGLIVEERQ